MLWLVMVAVELLIFMCVNKLLAGTGDPPGMIYPAGYGSGENSPPMTGMGILAVPNFYGGDGSGVAIPDGDLPIAILNSARRGQSHERGPRLTRVRVRDPSMRRGCASSAVTNGHPIDTEVASS